eukprot:GEMP01011355.1.p1 GENE.GEMP01011355.1~~GEMP01011355.1.p1  ORF type:complete len:668 (-),score=132.22 GEMP01011355.1:1241-3223(-)
MFGSLASEAGLHKLNDLLKLKSYIAGYSATAEDYKHFEEIAAPPDATKFPHAARWFNHIRVLKNGPQVLPVSTSVPDSAAKVKKDVVADKKKVKKTLEVDCVVVPCSDRKVLLDNPPPLGPASTCFPETKGQYYATTAISYTNGYPHIGHAYENLTTDIFVRYHRIFGRDTYFSTGADEHGQKIVQAAAKAEMKPQELCNMYVKGFKSLNQRLLVSNDVYIRTTSPEHKECCQELWKRCVAADDIYFKEYCGWYLVGEERFVTEQEAKDWNYKCPISGADLIHEKVPSYFFRMSKYQQRLLDHIEANPNWIRPESYRNLILSRLRSEPLTDLSVSRGTFDWGLSVPDGIVDGVQHVMYVWFDALTNYISSVNGLSTDELARFWPANANVIGKDILWFHTVIWGSMLMSSKVPLPKSVVVHGFVIAGDGRKMGKSLDNAVNPHDLLDSVSPDTLRWYLSRAAPYGSDIKFIRENLRDMHNADLLESWGNLVNRACNLAQGSIPKGHAETVPFDVVQLRDKMELLMGDYKLSETAECVLEACKDTNKWITVLEPWKMKKPEQQAEKEAVIRTLVEAVWVLAHFFAPFIPTASDSVFRKLNSPPKPIRELEHLRNLEDGTPVDASSVLFAYMENVPGFQETTSALEDAKDEKKGDLPNGKPAK